jgi:uncharacterized protein (PEP-CTERM system associated)
VLACLAGALAVAPRVARAQLLLPSAGADVRLGDMRQQFMRAFQTAPPASVPGWTITPVIDVALGWTDSVAGAAGGVKQKADFFTTVAPSVLIQGQTERVTATLSLAPQFQRYLTTPRQDSTNLNFNGQSRVTLVPETLFVDLRGAGYTQSQTGGYASTGSSNLSRNDQVQTLTFSIDPTLRHRFGGFGTAEIGYLLAQTTITGANAAVVSAFGQPITNQSTLTRTLHALFTSGEDFGRFNFGSQVLHTDNTGTGALAGAHRYTETVNLGYALSRRVQVLGTIGHEDVLYRAGSNFHVNGLTWDAKVKLLPNPESTITIGYGRHDGQNSFSLDADYAPSARVRLVAQYSEAVTTSQEMAQQALSGATLNAVGIPIDPRTGLPIGVGSNFFGVQTAVALVKQLTLGATLLRDRDVFSLNVQRQETSYLANGVSSSGQLRTTGFSGGASWQHDFSEALKGSIYLQYGVRDTGGIRSVSQQTVGASMGVTYAFTQTLSGRAQYSYSGSLGGSSATVPGYEQNLVTVGLRKSF